MNVLDRWRGLIGLAVVLVALGAAACSSDGTTPVRAGPSVADSADQVFLVARYLLTTKGIQRGDLTADTAYVLDEQTRFDLRKAHVNFTTEAGVPQGTMDANRGVYSTRTQILEGWGDVLVKLVDGRTLKSPHVVYNQISHQISSDTTYTLSRRGESQYGIGFISNQTFTTFRCLRNCGGSMAVLLPER
jgi:LPS export ABC transporter protein LptC